MWTVNDYLHAKAAKNRIPLNGTFELSPVCNFHCRMCYVRKTPEAIAAEGKRLRTAEEWLEMARQCYDAGTLYLLLTGGEPFLYPGFRGLYEKLHEMGFVLSINSNGTLIDEETVAWLKGHAPSRINVTLYGGSPETYGRICGNPGGFARAVRAVELLKAAGIPVVINASMIPENAGDMEAIFAIGRRLGIHVRMATYMFPPARREQERSDSRFTPEEAAEMFMKKAKCSLSPENYRKFLLEEPEKEDDGDWGESREEYMRCRAGRSGYWIAWDGTMTACAITPFPLVTQPFAEGFRSCWERLTDKVRTTPVLGGCAGCEHKHLCKPCVAILWAETGSPNEKAPYLCRMAACIGEAVTGEREKMYEKGQ